MISPTSSIPQLSLELTEKIISTLWSSPLSTHERAILVKASPLISRLWNNIFGRVYYEDIHILSSAHGLQFLDLLHGTLSISERRLLDQLCRSITIEHANRSLLPGPESEKEQPLGLVIRSILNDIFLSPDRLPYLRCISFQLENYLMETIFSRDKFYCLAPQVRELKFSFTYSDDIDPLVVQAIKSRASETFDLGISTMLDVQLLKVLGASAGVTRELLAACGGLENLREFEQDAWATKREPIPSTLHHASPIYTGGCDNDTEDDDDVDEVFYKSNKGGNSWAGCEAALASSFTKEELIRTMSAFHCGEQVSPCTRSSSDDSSSVGDWYPTTDASIWFDSSLDSSSMSSSWASVAEEKHTVPLPAVRHRPRFPDTRWNWLRGRCDQGYRCQYVHGNLEYDDEPSEKIIAQPPAQNKLFSNWAFTIHDHIKVRVGLGFAVESITTGFETPWIHISGLPAEVTTDELTHLL
ncbi:hypothetical protein PM082_016396 [Marasmius tenuissimus]|nr:hypothetical protein PM082_016396 [Marasmius tenuissimus]